MARNESKREGERVGDNTRAGCWIKHNWEKEMDDWRSFLLLLVESQHIQYWTRLHAHTYMFQTAHVWTHACTLQYLLMSPETAQPQGKSSQCKSFTHSAVALQAGANCPFTLSTPGWVSLDWPVQLLPLSSTRDQLVWAGSCNTSVIRLGKWRHLTRLQLRLKPYGPVCKLHCSHKQSHWNKATKEKLGFWKA